ncbi:MAG: YcaO-like family protein, partial [Synergistaceae bacterium]|nr:YcaO-like family protein [Synergistaceae bacterium]
REAWALDITSDLGIPAFVAVSRRIGEREERLFFGLGCHLDARIALQRAFAEMNQMLSIGSGGGEDDLAGLQDKETLSWMRTATLANKPYMAPDPSKPLRTFSDYPVRHTDDFLEDIAYCRRLIEAKGMEMLALDQTRPDTGMPVVKVVVPGFRHFWARFAPGRLYDVPAATGLLKKTLKEEELNPVPFFF